VVLVVAAVVVARKCCGLKGQAGCLGFPKDLQATPPSPTTNQWRRGNENPKGNEKKNCTW
jgi:predicted small lipoprotein YifL